MTRPRPIRAVTKPMFFFCDGSLGCSCPEDREAHTARESDREASLPPHGTRNRYKRGCSCKKCRMAHARYHREYDRKKREANV